MNIINKLTLRQMRLNKRKTLVTIIGIIIAVSMITAISAGINSVMGYFAKMAEEGYTRFHIKVSDFEYEDRNIVDETVDVEKYALAKVVEDCFMKLGEGTMSLTPYEYISENVEKAEKEIYMGDLPEGLRIMAVEDSYYEMMNIELSKGRFPENSSEIILSEIIWSLHLVEPVDVGDKISVGDREYTVCGFIGTEGDFIDTNNDYENSKLELPGCLRSYAAYTFFDYSTLNDKDIVSGYYYLEKPYSGVESAARNIIEELKEKTSATVGTIDAGGGQIWYSKGIDVEYNYDVMMFYGVSESPVIDIVVFVVKLFLSGIIMVGAIFLIANSFIITIAERTRYLGMLASVGATARQRRMSVYFEGFIEGIIGIPIGIVTGIVGMSIIFEAIKPLVMELSGLNMGIELMVDWGVIARAVLFSIITIFLSAYVPARRVSKISAIDAIRQNKDIRVTARDVNIKRVTRRVLGIEGELALKNLKRNGKRYKVTIFSLFMSVVLFMSVYSVVSFLREQCQYENRARGYSIEVTKNRRASKEMYVDTLQYDDVYKKVTDSMMSADCTNEYSRFFDTWNIDDFNAVIKNEEDIYNADYMEAVREAKIYEDYNRISIISMAPEDLKIYLQKIGIEYDDFVADEGNAILFDGDMIEDTTTLREKYLYIGDAYNDSVDTFDVSIEFDQDMINDSYFDENGKLVEVTDFPTDMEFEFHIYSREEKIIGMNSYPYLLVTPQVIQKIMHEDPEAFGQVAYFLTDDDKALEQIYDSILKSYGVDSDNGYHIQNIADLEREMVNMLFLIEVFTYIFIGLITLICVANIINTLSTGMSLRRAEFAMLKSIGMTPKAFKKMLIYEGAIYGMKAFLYGLPIGTIIILGTEYLFEEYGGFVLSIPSEVYLIVIISVLFIIGITLLCSSGKIRKENIIEGLKNENH